MKRLTSRFGICISILMILLLGSCIPEFKEGLPVPKKSKVDKELLGTWYAKADSHVEWFAISAKSNGYIEIREYSETNEPKYLPLLAYTSTS
jgi:hypothetical protein